MKNLKRCSSTLELLPHDVVEHIMERLPAKSLLSFKCVSKKWKSTIESVYFQKRQLIHSSDDPQLLLLYVPCDGVDVDVAVAGPNIQALEPPVTAVKIPTESTFVSQTTCDGLVCVYSLYKSGMVANPTTRWTRTFPPSAFQHLILDLQDKFFDLEYPFPLLGFGKDNLRTTYKLVWLYNSSELGLDHATTCEVFDFTSNSWRFVLPSSPHRIIAFREPLYFDGSLHWFTECQVTKLLSFSLHSETFQVISNKLPFADDDHVHDEDIAMCTLHNILCISHKKQLDQLIWSFDSGNKTWVKLYSIDLTTTSPWFGMHQLALSALALPLRTGKKTNLFLYDREYYQDKQRLVSHDPETNSYDLVFTTNSVGRPLCYLQSLISIS